MAERQLMAAALSLAVMCSACDSPTSPDWSPAQPEVAIGTVVFTAVARRGDGDRLTISLLAGNEGPDTVSVEILGGPCLMIARVFSDPEHRHVKWQSKKADEECVIPAHLISLRPKEVAVIERTWEYRITARSYVTAEFRHSRAYHLDAGRVDPR